MIEIEGCDGRNGDLLFHPSGDRVRGRFEPAKVNAPELGTLPREFPNGVPGMLIRFDPATSTGSIVDPLHDAVNAPTRAAIEKRLTSASVFTGSVDFGQPVKEYPNAHAGTWLGWMRRAVVAGLAKLTKGKLPESDPPDMRRGFYTPEPKADPKDALITQLVGLLTAKLSPTERKELAGLLGTAGAK